MLFLLYYIHGGDFMIYVMSDLHGAYEKYLEMLEKINFSDDDTLYVIGDVIDRGQDSIKILQDMMNRYNVYPILGNHELMAITVLKQLMVQITSDNAETYLTESIMQSYIDWTFNGGNTTLQEFQKLTNEQKYDIISYLEEFTPYETIDINDKTYILVHAGLNNFNPRKKLKSYSLYELTCIRPDYEKQYFKDSNIFIVCGHTPTPLISGKTEIYHSHNNICIDCGATFKTGKLACLCLDTMEEFYV